MSGQYDDIIHLPHPDSPSMTVRRSFHPLPP